MRGLFPSLLIYPCSPRVSRRWPNPVPKLFVSSFSYPACVHPPPPLPILLALPETAPAALLSPQQQYHQTISGWGRWRVLSLYAFVASGRSPQPPSTPTPSLRLRSFPLLCCCLLLLLQDRTPLLSPPRCHQPTTGSRRWRALSLYAGAACRRPPQAVFMAVQVPLCRLCSVPSPQPLLRCSGQAGALFF